GFYWYERCAWTAPEVDRMRGMRTLFAVIVYSCLASTPVAAGQRGQHTASAAPAARPAIPSHPATNAAHPAPVPVPHELAANPALVTRLQPLLPSGMTIATAATGFKNQGQFIAALHVSHNLNIPFAQVKARMTGGDHDSLGQAIHELKPAANAKAAVTT